MLRLVHQSLASSRRVSSALGLSQTEFPPSSDTRTCSLAQAANWHQTRRLVSGAFSFPSCYPSPPSPPPHSPPPPPAHSFSSSFSSSWESGCIMAGVVWCPCSLLSPVLSVTELFPQRPTQTARVDYRIEYSILHYIKVQYKTVQYRRVHYITDQFSTVLYSIKMYSTLGTVKYNKVQHSSIQYSTVQYSKVRYIMVEYITQTAAVFIWQNLGSVEGDWLSPVQCSALYC